MDSLPATNLAEELVATYALNERMNQIVLEQLHPAAWRAHLPGSKTRTIAAIVAHVHNVRRKWIRLSAPHLPLPAELHRATCTQQQARAALLESAGTCSEMLAQALIPPGGPAPAIPTAPIPSRIKTFHRDGYAPPWPAGPSMLAYMLTHDAHHRGQICMLAHQLGHPLPPAATSQIWAWEKLRKQD